MKTRIIRINPREPETGKIARAADILRKGGLVAFPTETVYGLGANALDGNAVKKIFRAKGRPSDNPMIVHVSDYFDVFVLAYVNKTALRLMDAFWPGALTLVMRSRKTVPSVVRAGLSTVAIRMPSHPVALALIHESDVPIAAPSANISGRPSPTQAKHVIADLKGRIDCIIDSGKTQIGLESTVLDVSRKIPMLLRPGKISVEDIEKTIGKIRVHKSVSGNLLGKKEVAKAPGMKYRHYAPNAKVIVVEGKISKGIAQKIKALAKGKKTALLGNDRAGSFGFDFVAFGKNKTEMASSLFCVFRELDGKGYEIIVVQGTDERGLGLAIMNRVRKAAWKIIE